MINLISLLSFYASKVLKDVFENYDKYLVKSKRLSIKNQTTFSLDAMTKKFEEILDKYLPTLDSQPQQVNLKLPKLKKIEKKENFPKLELPKLKKVK